MENSNLPYGAFEAEWDNLSLMQGLTADLLPVVSNPKSKVSPNSKLKATGKTPSIYDRNNQVVGLARWTERQSTEANIEAWKKQADYGICIQTRTIRALDIDVEDAAQAEAIKDDILSYMKKNTNYTAVVRSRVNSAKCLVAFRLEGDFTKRVMKTEHGMIEFLATGQQFVAHGTHPSGSRYEWSEDIVDFCSISSPDFEELWGMLVKKYAIEPPKEMRKRLNGASRYWLR